MKFKSFLNEKNEVKKVVIITSSGSPEKNGELRTSYKFKKEAEKMGFIVFMAIIEDLWLTKKEIPGDYILRNKNNNKPFSINPKNTIIINREATTKHPALLNMISQLEKSEYFIINGRETIEVCSDKFRTTIRLSEHNIPVPKTRIIRNVEDIELITKDFDNKFPLVVKTTSGTQGIGVFLIKSVPDMRAILQTIWKINSNVELILQEFIKTDRDYRIHVLGNKIIAGMERIKKTEDFRTNYSLGNSTKHISVEKIPDDMKKLALLSAKASGAIWCGVDIIKNKKGDLFVIEVNSSPGTTGIENGSDLNVAKIVLNFAKDINNWYIPPTEVGYVEYAYVEPIGKVMVKMDTGNGPAISIHSENYDIINKKVIWKHNGKIYTNKLEGTIGVKTVNKTENRPLIKTNIKFAGFLYKDIIVCLDDRSDRSTPVLFNREFLKKLNVVVNSGKKYTIVYKE